MGLVLGILAVAAGVVGIKYSIMAIVAGVAAIGTFIGWKKGS